MASHPPPIPPCPHLSPSSATLPTPTPAPTPVPVGTPLDSYHPLLFLGTVWQLLPVRSGASVHTPAVAMQQDTCVAGLPDCARCSQITKSFFCLQIFIICLRARKCVSVRLRLFVCVFVYVRVCACMCACVYAHVCLCMCIVICVLVCVRTLQSLNFNITHRKSVT